MTTATVRGDTAFNSFKQFDVKRGKTVNLHLPGGTDNLLNLVHKRKTKIDGILNGYQNGQIGGNVFFLNPYGVAVSSSGVVNVGSFTAITPTKEFMNDFFSGPGNPSAAATASVLSGDVPLRGFAAIAVDGQINAERDVTLMAGDVTVKGVINAGAAAQSAVGGFGSFVNVNGVEVGADLIVDNGTVTIVAADDVKITGQINVDGKAGVAGGSISIDAGDTIVVEKNAVISAKGQGANSNGGVIISFAQDDARIDDNAIVDVSAGSSGDGGFIEFSAKDKLDIDGGQFLAAAANGLPGTILLDPDILNLDIDIFTGGATMLFEADEEINVNGITISSRQIAGTDHVNDASIGDSGDLRFRAKKVHINPGSQLLAHASDGYSGGVLEIEARNQVVDTFGVVEAEVFVIDSLLKGAGIFIGAYGASTNSALMAGEIVTDVSVETRIEGSTLDAGSEDSIGIYAVAWATSVVEETVIPEEVSIDQEVSALVQIGGDSSFIAGRGVEFASNTHNELAANLSNEDNAEYLDVSAVFSNLTSNSVVNFASGDSALQFPDVLQVETSADTEVFVNLVHHKQDGDTPSAALAVSEVASNAEVIIARDIDAVAMDIISASLIESDVTATTEFPIAIMTLLESGDLDASELPFTMTTAASKHNNVAKGGFFNDAVINGDYLALAVAAVDQSQLHVEPGYSVENTHIMGVVDGDFQSNADLYFMDLADVTVAKYYQLYEAVETPESIDGLSEVARNEVTSEMGLKPVFTKLWKIQNDSGSSSNSSYIFIDEWEATEDSDETSDMTSDSGSTMDSGGDSGEGYSYEYSTESSYDTSSDSSSSSSSSSTSSSTSEETSESESSSESDSTFEFEAESSSSSSSSSTP